jgi:curved DNA-binding protein CbpA
MASLTEEEACKILEIRISSSDEEVKSAYKRLALKTHPDKNPNDPAAHQRFLQISEAYKKLSDPRSFNDDYNEDDFDRDEDFDYQEYFAFRMFEKIFERRGPTMRSGKAGFSSRQECDCPHCRCFYTKPKAPYIPKSQRPKDPNAKVAPPVNPDAPDDWLLDHDDMKKNVAKKTGKSGRKKTSSKKKSSKAGACNHSLLLLCCPNSPLCNSQILTRHIHLVLSRLQYAILYL